MQRSLISGNNVNEEGKEKFQVKISDRFAAYFKFEGVGEQCA
jgi:hypothetical protein